MSTKPPNQSVKLTKTVVEKCPLPPTGQAFLRDSQLPGFALRVTAKGTRSFIVEKRINARVRRITLGRFGELTVEEARRMAKVTLGKIAFGTDPIAEKRQAQLKALTLGEVYREFVKARKPHLKPRTLYDYDLLMRGVFKDWQPKPITDIRKVQVSQRHRELGEQHGEAYANQAMRFLRAVLNFAQAQYDDGAGHSLLLENPVRVLTQTRSWYRVPRRRTVIKNHQLPAWYRAIEALRDPASPDTAHTVADYLLLLLFTGLRRQEAVQLRWEHVDLKDRTLTIPDPKNHVPHTLPLSDFVLALLTRRQALAANGYVFPGKDDTGYLIEPKRQIAKVIAVSQVVFTLHDLRRTFATVAEGLDIAGYTLKRLLNHTIHGDVTAGYIVTDVERLRGPMERISRFLCSAMGMGEPSNVVPLARASRPAEAIPGEIVKNTR